MPNYLVITCLNVCNLLLICTAKYMLYILYMCVERENKFYVLLLNLGEVYAICCTVL